MHYSQGLTLKAHRACIADVQHTQCLRALHFMVMAGNQTCTTVRVSHQKHTEHALQLFSMRNVSELCTSWSWQGTKHAPESGSRPKSTQGMHCSSLANTRSQSSESHGHTGSGEHAPESVSKP